MSESLISFANVSRFYGEVLGINKVNLTIPPGVPSARARPPS
jgi:ABC-2 type transport system ATP-binding protein